MIAIGNNFFYTRSLPCTLWFFDRGKESLRTSPQVVLQSDKTSPPDPLLSGEGRNEMSTSGERSGVRFSKEGESHRERSADTVLMFDARKIYHKVTQKINDFSPEQLKNLTCIVYLYRGNTKKFRDTVNEYLETSFNLAKYTAEALKQTQAIVKQLHQQVTDFAKSLSKENEEAKSFAEKLYFTDPEPKDIYDLQSKLINLILNASPKGKRLEEIASQCKHLRKPQDKLIKQLLDAVSFGVKEFQLNKNVKWKELNIKEQLDKLKDLQKQLSGNPDEEEPGLLHETEYFWKQAHWLQSRFPDGMYKDVEGLCKVVTRKEISEKDYSLSPGRYVGVDVGTDEDFDYEERLKEIHIELEGLNEEAVELAKTISENYKEFLV
jgi:type I restriction enzyme M protein